MSSRPLPVAVVDAAGASACDNAAIAAGIPSRALMQRAGAAAAAEIALRLSDRLAHGVLVERRHDSNALRLRALLTANPSQSLLK
jgi:hypothetical protein